MLGLNQYLQSHGLSREMILEMVRPLGPDESLLLVGSVAEGLAVRRSDLDLLLIADDCEEGSSGDLLQGMPQGFELNVELVSRSHARAMCGWLLNMLGPTPQCPNQGLLSITFAGADQLRLLHRLRTGIPLKEPQGSIEELRREAPLHLLPDLCILQHSACHIRLRDDAQQADASPSTAILMAQLSAHHLAAAMLASVGETNPNPKWLCHLLKDHRNALGDFPVGRIEDLFFAGLVPDASDMVAKLTEASNQVLERLVVAAHESGSVIADALEGIVKSERRQTGIAGTAQ